MLIDGLLRLRRVTNGKAWIPQIDGLRFIAITGILLYHLGGEVAERSGRIIPIEARYAIVSLVIGNADRAVRLFFVISGFVLALPFARHYLEGARSVSVKAYYLRRITRLEPPYILSLLLLTVLVGTYTHTWGRDLLLHAVASMLYVHDVTYARVSTINMVAWSLEVEVQFYIVAPLIMKLLAVKHAWMRRSLLLTLILLSAPLATSVLSFSHLSGSLLRYFGYFLAGLLAAELFVSRPLLCRKRSLYDVVALMSLAVSLALPRSELVHAILPLLFGSLCLCSMLGPVFSRVLSIPAVAVVGGMCYSIYLLHMTVIAFVFKASRYLIISRADYMVNYIIQCMVLIPCVLGVSAAFFALVERPCMDPEWPKQLARFIRNRTSVMIRG